MFIQINFNKVYKYLYNKFPIWLVVYLVFSIGTPKLGIIPTTLINIVSPVFLGVLVISAAYSWRSLSNQILRHFDMSYGIYIYHMVVVNVLITLNYKGSASTFLVATLLSFLLGALSWRFIEKPMLKLKKRALRSVII
jgi:peptidoglycan/LPS O-acetylase OafA/YrhL